MTEPWGTSDITGTGSERKPLTMTLCVLLVRKDKSIEECFRKIKVDRVNVQPFLKNTDDFVVVCEQLTEARMRKPC